MTAPSEGKNLVLATRRSALALAQSRAFARALEGKTPGLAVEELHVVTSGDKDQTSRLQDIGGKGLFIKELEEALYAKSADFAVHSIKDVPAELAPGLAIACVPPREDPRDALVGRGGAKLADLAQGAKVGTSSLRRALCLKRARPDLVIEPLRGNVDTRLRKVDEGLYDAIVLAYAGLRRLGLEARATDVLSPSISLPAIGQGALGIECRESDDDVKTTLVAMAEDDETWTCVAAERAVMAAVEGDCKTPVAAHAKRDGETLVLEGLLAEPDGSRARSGSRVVPFPKDRAEAERVGRDLGEELLPQLMDLLLVLHAHLPWVKDAAHPGSIEERWLFEALWESYLPLLGVLDRAQGAGLRGVLTLSLSPTLLAMLGDARLRESFLDHLDALEDVAAHASRGVTPERARAVAHHLARMRKSRARFVEADGDVAAAFGAHHRRGTVELVTTAATHAILPASASPGHVRAQIASGQAALERACGVTPAGLWLPECAYDPRLDAVLADLEVGFTFLDAHGVEHGIPRSPLGASAPIVSPSGLAVFPRDASTARRVWSRREGYPGDPAYREFHRDVASELDDAALGRLAPRPSERTPVGIRPYRVTGRDDKEIYNPAAASARTAVHALDFLRVAEATLAAAPRVPEAPPLLVAAYDAELFGHWWWEGPELLERTLRDVGTRTQLKLTTPSVRLAAFPYAALSQPAASTWGEGGYSTVWASTDTAPMLREIRRAERAVESAFATPRVDASTADGRLRLQARDAAARELMLGAASDWAFLVRTGTNVGYAKRRAAEHVERAVELGRIATAELSGDEARAFVDRVVAEGAPETLAPSDVLAWAYAVG